MSIEIKITANNADELQGQLEDVLSVLTGPDATPVKAKPKTKRRTQAEIAADKAAEKAAEQTEVLGGPAEPAIAEPEPATKKDVERVMHELLGFGDAGTGKMLKMLTDLGAVNGEGEVKLSALAEDRYAEAVEAGNNLLAGLGAAG